MKSLAKKREKFLTKSEISCLSDKVLEYLYILYIDRDYTSGTMSRPLLIDNLTDQVYRLRTTIINDNDIVYDFAQKKYYRVLSRDQLHEGTDTTWPLLLDFDTGTQHLHIRDLFIIHEKIKISDEVSPNIRKALYKLADEINYIISDDELIPIYELYIIDDSHANYILYACQHVWKK